LILKYPELFLNGQKMVTGHDALLYHLDARDCGRSDGGADQFNRNLLRLNQNFSQ
jgi:hypothetical protein